MKVNAGNNSWPGFHSATPAYHPWGTTLRHGWLAAGELQRKPTVDQQAGFMDQQNTTWTSRTAVLVVHPWLALGQRWANDVSELECIAGQAKLTNSLYCP